MRVLVACEFSGKVRNAFAKRGHDAWSCDLLPTLTPGQHIRGDVRQVLADDWDLMIAHPPCTYLTIAANRYHNNPDREAKREAALVFVAELLLAPIPKIALENPVGVISTRIRKPNQIIQPFWFGHPDKKTTCLWLKGLAPLLPTAMCDPIMFVSRGGNSYSLSATMPPHPMRGYVRSITYDGIAEAMAQQWG